MVSVLWKIKNRAGKEGKGVGAEEGADFSFKMMVRTDLVEKMTIVQRFRAGKKVSL